MGVAEGGGGSTAGLRRDPRAGLDASVYRVCPWAQGDRWLPELVFSEAHFQRVSVGSIRSLWSGLLIPF